MDDYSDKWKEICFLLDKSINPNCTEKEFENQVVRALELLGWKEYKNEILRQQSIKVGRNTSIRPDIVICNDTGNTDIAIEIKRPSEDLFNYNSISQLTSYMRQVKSDFGFLIGRELRIYYDGHLNKHPDPLWIESINFNNNDPKGISFVNNFSKNNFKSIGFKEYLNQKIKNFNKQAEVEKLVNILVLDSTKAMFSSFLKTIFSDYGEDVLLTALKGVSINISRISDKKIEKNDDSKNFKKISSPNRTRIYSQDRIEIPKNIETPDKSKIILQFENRAKDTLAQIYFVLFFMKKGFNFPSSVKYSLNLFPDVKDYQTIADKCGRRFAGSIPLFEKWFETGEMLYNLRRKYSLNNYEFKVFKEILED